MSSPVDSEPDQFSLSICSILDGSFSSLQAVYTADDGTYRIEGLRGGNYSISIFDLDEVYLESDYPSGSIAVLEGEETSHVDIKLVKGGIIKGTIRNHATGSPISGLIVLAAEKILGYPPLEDLGYYPLEDLGYPPSEDLWYPPLENPELSAPPIVGPSLPAGLLYVEGPPQPMGQTFYSSPSDNQGGYRIKGLSEGSYIVYIVSEKGYQTQYYSLAGTDEEAMMVAVSRAQTVDNIDFNLIQGMSLEGRVRDAITGEIIAKGCTVTLMNEQMREIKSTDSDSSGNYIFIGLSPGTYYVQAMDYKREYYQGGYHAEGSVAQAPDPIIISPAISREEITISLFPRASLNGEITDEYDLKPLDSLVVIAMPADYDPRIIHSYAAPFSYPGSFPIPDTPDAPSAEPYAFEITESPPIGYGMVGPYSSSSSNEQLQFALTDKSGRYTVKNLEEGDYRILVLDPAYIYEGEYYRDVSPDRWEDATIIHIKRSENREGIDMQLHVGEVYAEKNEYPYILLRDHQPTLGYIGVSSEAFSYQSAYSGGSGGSGGGDLGFRAYQPDAPVEIISKPVDQIAVGRSFIYQVQVSEHAPDVYLAYALNKNPSGMTIDPESGLIEWQPTHEERGSHIVQVQVYRSGYQPIPESAFQSFRLEVVEDRIPPEDIQNLTAQEENQQITLVWTPSQDSAGDLTEQILYIDNGTGYGEGTELGKAATTYTVTNVENEKSYTFKITTRDDLENESAGAMVTTIPQAPARIQTTFSFQEIYPSSDAWNIDTPWKCTILGSYWDNLRCKTKNAPWWNTWITPYWWELPGTSLFNDNNSFWQQKGINSY